MTVEESVKNEEKRTGRLDLMQSWDCSQIENEEEEKLARTKWQNNGKKSNNWKE